MSKLDDKQVNIDLLHVLLSYHQNGKRLNNKQEILSRWTENCLGLYNYVNRGDNAVLGSVLQS